MTVELDRRPGEETPRVTVKRFQPLDNLAKRTRLHLLLRITDQGLIPLVGRELANAKGGNGAVRAILPISENKEAVLVVGRDYTLDADLAARLTRILGDGAVELSAQDPPRLALVG